MSILSFFFTGMARNALETKNDTVPPDFPRLRTGTILRLSTADGPLLSGPVAHFSRTGLTLSSPPGSLPFPPCGVGTVVDLEPEDGNNALFCLRGTVELVDGENCRLAAVELLPRAGLALNPLFTDVPAALYEEDDVGFTHPEHCKLVQAGNNSFTFQSEFPHCVEERIRVVLSIEDCFPLTMCGQIVRMEMSTTGVFRFELRSDRMEEQPSGAQ